MLEINTKTTGFGSPAEQWVDKRLDLNDLIIEDHYTTYYFRYSGSEKFGIKEGDILVVDKSKFPEQDDIVITKSGGKLVVDKFNFNNEQLWGTVTWILSRTKK